MTHVARVALLSLSLLLAGTGTAPAKAPAGGKCSHHAQCRSGICEGQGCGGSQGTCASKQRRCPRDLVPYCGCDGRTHQASSRCAGFRYQYRGACSAARPGPSAAKPAPPAPRPLAGGTTPRVGLEVRQVVSRVTPTHVLRAVVGVEEIYPFLVVEVIQRGQTEGDRDRLVSAKRVTHVRYGARRLSLAGQGLVEIRHLRWAGETLTLKLPAARRAMTCRLEGVTKGASQPHCVPARGSR